MWVRAYGAVEDLRHSLDLQLVSALPYGQGLQVTDGVRGLCRARPKVTKAGIRAFLPHLNRLLQLQAWSFDSIRCPVRHVTRRDHDVLRWQALRTE